MLDISLLVHVLSRSHASCANEGIFENHYLGFKVLLSNLIGSLHEYLLRISSYFFLGKEGRAFYRNDQGFFFFLIGGWKTLKDAVS